MCGVVVGLCIAASNVGLNSNLLPLHLILHINETNHDAIVETYNENLDTTMTNKYTDFYLLFNIRKPQT